MAASIAGPTAGFTATAAPMAIAVGPMAIVRAPMAVGRGRAGMDGRPAAPSRPERRLASSAPQPPRRGPAPRPRLAYAGIIPTQASDRASGTPAPSRPLPADWNAGLSTGQRWGKAMVRAHATRQGTGPSRRKTGDPLVTH